MKTKLNLADKNIAIVTHRSILPCIPGDDLKRFLLNCGVNKLIYITHPLLLLKESYELRSKYEYHHTSKLMKTASAYQWILPEFLSYIKDFLYSIYWVLKSGQTFDIYFGMNNLNAFAGLVLKKLGRVKKVVYYTIDLYPQRFSSKIINWIYHKLDNICVKFCDETWNVSPFIAQWRARRGMIGNNYSRQFTVPIGIWFDDMKRVPLNKVNQKKIVYVGHLKNFYGVDLIIRALPLIRKKIPGIRLEIIGGGEQMEELKELANELSASLNVKFYGWKDKKQAEQLMSDGAIGLAPFNILIIDEKIKNADPAKIKDYLALGLPVVMTNATLNANSIAKAKCGAVVDYTPESLANAVIKLLSNENLRQEYRKNALEYVSQFDWNKLFSKNVSRLV